MSSDQKLYKDRYGNAIGVNKPDTEWDDGILLHSEKAPVEGLEFGQFTYVLLAPKQARKLAKTLKKYADIIDPPKPELSNEW